MKKVQNRKLKTVPLCTWRYYVMIAVLLCGFGALVTRAAYLQVVNAEELAEAGESRSVRVKGISSHRGLILDRNGVELARSVPTESVWLDPKTLLANEGVLQSKEWKAFAAALKRNENQLNQWVKDRADKRFVWLERHVDPNVGLYIKRLDIPGVEFKTEYRRYYPSAELTAHLVGFTGIDDKGLEGVERAFDSFLTGQPGSKQVVVDLYRRVVEERGVLAQAEQGNDLQLSIDSRIQATAYKELKKAVLQNGAKGGSVVVVDVDTGEVLAMASQPSFNPNRSDSRLPEFTRNRSITDLFEPGSTVKPLTVVSGLSSGKFSTNSKVDTSPGRMKLGYAWVRDPRNYGVLDLDGIIKKSSNMGVSKIALELSDEEFLSTYYKVGFGMETGLGIQGEADGILAPRANWSEHEKASMSYGYGFMVSPIQLAQAYAILGAGGVRNQLTLIKRTDGQEYPQEQVIQPEIARAVVKMMEEVVSEGGTGTQAKVEGYRVAGKTGTSRKAVRGGYGDEYVTVFAGLVPASDPKFAIVVMVDEPAGDSYYGGTVSAPVFSKVADKALHLLNIAPDNKSQKNAIATATNVVGGQHD
ncbi:peptidoglycan glycosyltransferase FtsI [Kangiella profundi]|uniref:Peptidoglycan D,D-transpeptidase FtsI n=1 Tax=Kangiella profundi TaxID=1561924 RepID=A0A2K9AKW4_9GAMM|nr:penicillin-binding transpeptidase domain-containing protein [Kangiella profundi]AUD78282.1 peptidoglycan glycosyltransferase FtsI [Kangiella profundi]GGF06762.1 peptidoglycan glycosyltransferase FtsI [Kangiella profundi]